MPALDGIRFIAVFLVIFYHFGISGVPGGHGVMLFFVLSGFLITWLLIKENEKTGTISLSGFFKRRILRIFPAFYGYALVTIVLLLAAKKEVPWLHAGSAFLYFSNYYTAFYPDSNDAFSHTWSLAVEEQFYLFFPFLFLIFCRNMKQLTSAISGVIVAAWLWRVILVLGFNASGGYIYSAFDTRIDHLLVGCFLAVVLRQKEFPKFWELALKNSLMPFLTISLLAISVFFTQQNVVYKSTIGFAIEPVLMAVLITQLIAFSAHGFWKWLDFEPIKFLGSLSYSLYLYQQLTTSVIPTRLENFPVLIQLAATIFGTITIAALSFYIVETPFLELKTMSPKDVIRYNLLKLKALFGIGDATPAALKEFIAKQKQSKIQGELIEERK